MHARGARGSAPARAPTGRCGCATASTPGTVRHAHGYVVQTLADLGWVGLGLSLLAAVAWLAAAVARRRRPPARPRAAVGRRARRARRRWPPSRSSSACTRRSTGRGSCPATSCPRCCARAGWRRARRCASASAASSSRAAAARPRRAAGRPPPRSCSCSAPRRRLERAAARALGARAGRRARARSTRARCPRAASIARIAHDRNPLAVEPLFELAAIEQAAEPARPRPTRALEQAIDLEPANPETWRRLGALPADALERPDGRAARLPGRLLPRSALAAEPVRRRHRVARLATRRLARATSIRPHRLIAHGAKPAASSVRASERRVKKRTCWPSGSKWRVEARQGDRSGLQTPWYGTVSSSRPPGLSTRRTS